MSTQSSKRSRLESADAILDESSFNTIIAGNLMLENIPCDRKTSKIRKEDGCINKLEQIFSYESSDQHIKLLAENKYLSKVIFLWNKLYNDAKTIRVENKISFLTNTELDINANRFYLNKNNLPHLSNQFIDMDYTFFSDELQKSIDKSINLEDMQVHIRSFIEDIKRIGVSEHCCRSYFQNLFYITSLEVFRLYNLLVTDEYINNLYRKSKINIFPMNYANISSPFSKQHKLSQSSQFNKIKTNAAINKENLITAITKKEKVTPEKENSIRQAFEDKLRKDLDSALKRNDDSAVFQQFILYTAPAKKKKKVLKKI